MNSNKGFTLVQIFLVVVILTVLASVLVSGVLHNYEDRKTTVATAIMEPADLSENSGG